MLVKSAPGVSRGGGFFSPLGPVCREKSGEEEKRNGEKDNERKRKGRRKKKLRRKKQGYNGRGCSTPTYFAKNVKRELREKRRGDGGREKRNVKEAKLNQML